MTSPVEGGTGGPLGAAFVDGLNAKQMLVFESLADDYMIEVLTQVADAYADKMLAEAGRAAALTAADVGDVGDAAAAGAGAVDPAIFASVPAAVGESLAVTMLPLVAEVYQSSQGKVRAGLIDATHATLPPVHSLDAAAYLRRAPKVFDDIGDQLQANIRAGLAEGFEAGESIPQLAQRVRAAAGVTSRKATLIARTSVIDASNVGSMDMAKASGIEMIKEWLAVVPTDGRTRPTHIAADGQRVDLHAKFTVGGYECDHPGEYTLPDSEKLGCRCTQGFVVPRAQVMETTEGQAQTERRLRELRAQREALGGRTRTTVTGLDPERVLRPDLPSPAQPVLLRGVSASDQFGIVRDDPANALKRDELVRIATDAGLPLGGKTPKGEIIAEIRYWESATGNVVLPKTSMSVVPRLLPEPDPGEIVGGLYQLKVDTGPGGIAGRAVTDVGAPFEGRVWRVNGTNYAFEFPKRPLTPREQSIVMSTLDDLQRLHGELPAASDYTQTYVWALRRNPKDAYWAQKYGIPNFESAATAGRGTVVIWNRKGYGKVDSGGIDSGTLAHETGHNLDNLKAKKEGIGSDSTDWADAIEADALIPRPVGIFDRRIKPKSNPAKAVPDGSTEYGQSSLGEDFAEAYEMYLRGRLGRHVDGTDIEFRDIFPHRAAIFDRLLPEYGAADRAALTALRTAEQNDHGGLPSPAPASVADPAAKMTVTQLRDLAANEGIEGVRALKKADLLAALRKWEADNGRTILPPIRPVVVTVPDAGAARVALRGEARARQLDIDKADHAVAALSDVDELVSKRADIGIIEARLQEGITAKAFTKVEADAIRKAVATGDATKIDAALTRVAKKRGVTFDGRAGELTTMVDVDAGDSPADRVAQALAGFKPERIGNGAQADAYFASHVPTLTRAQADALEYYSGKSFELNKAIAAGDLQRDARTIRNIDNALYDLPDDLVVLRSTELADLGITDSGDLADLVGTVYHRRAYTSTALGVPYGGGRSGVLMHIAVPKGTKGALMERFTVNPGEREVLLGRDMDMVITKVERNKTDSGWDVYATVVPKAGTRTSMRSVSGATIRPGAQVRVVRRGATLTRDGETITLEPTTVREVTPDELAGLRQAVVDERTKVANVAAQIRAELDAGPVSAARVGQIADRNNLSLPARRALVEAAKTPDGLKRAVAAQMKAAEVKASGVVNRGVAFDPETMEVKGARSSAPAGPLTPERFDARVTGAATGDDALRVASVDLGTSAERAAYAAYVSDYRYINSNLREFAGRIPTTRAFARERKTIAGLDAAMARSGLTQDIQVYRLSGTVEFPDGVPRVGAEWTDHGYTSTSAQPKYGARRGEVSMRILAPKGTRAVATSELDVNEVLLDRGMRFRVVKVSGPDELGVTHVDVEVVPDAPNAGAAALDPGAKVKVIETGYVTEIDGAPVVLRKAVVEPIAVKVPPTKVAKAAVPKTPAKTPGRKGSIVPAKAADAAKQADVARAFAGLAIDVEENAAKGASVKAIQHRVRAALKRLQIEKTPKGYVWHRGGGDVPLTGRVTGDIEIDAAQQMADLAADVERLTDQGATPEQLINAARAHSLARGLEPTTARAGDVVPFDREAYVTEGARPVAGSPVLVVRPGYATVINGERIVIEKPLVLSAPGQKLTSLVTPIHDLFEADIATVEAAMRDVYEGKFGPYTTKVKVGRRSAGTDKRGRPTEPSIHIEGKIYTKYRSPAGYEYELEIGNFGRSISPVTMHYGDVVRREVWAEHSIVQLEDKYQGKGFGGTFNKRVIDWYRESGVHGISLSDHNGYVWASQGFDYEAGGMGDTTVEALRELIDALRSGRTKDRYGVVIPKALREAKDLEAQLAAAEDILRRASTLKPGQPGYPTAYEVSQAGRTVQKGKTSTWFGKHFAFNNGATSEMILNPDEGVILSP